MCPLLVQNIGRRFKRKYNGLDQMLKLNSKGLKLEIAGEENFEKF